MDEKLFERIEDAISKVRDAAPRDPRGADSGDVAEAVMKVLGDFEQRVRSTVADQIHDQAMAAHELGDDKVTQALLRAVGTARGLA